MIMRIAFGTFWIRFRVHGTARDRESERGYSPLGGGRTEENGSEAIEWWGRMSEETNVLTLYRCEMPRVKEGIPRVRKRGNGSGKERARRVKEW